MIVFFGILCGYKTIEEIHFLCGNEHKRIEKYWKLENGASESDTTMHILAWIDSKQQENAFVRYAEETFGK